jgi:hypothetical protein
MLVPDFNEDVLALAAPCSSLCSARCAVVPLYAGAKSVRRRRRFRPVPGPVRNACYYRVTVLPLRAFRYFPTTPPLLPYSAESNSAPAPLRCSALLRSAHCGMRSDVGAPAEELRRIRFGSRDATPMCRCMHQHNATAPKCPSSGVSVAASSHRDRSRFGVGHASYRHECTSAPVRHAVQRRGACFGRFAVGAQASGIASL